MYMSVPLPDLFVEDSEVQAIILVKADFSY